MLALYNGESHDFIFRCYRGTTNVLEDFTGCQVFLFLVGSDKTKISATVDGKAIRFTLPSGLNTEAYDVEVIWSKNASKTVTKYHLNHDVYNYALVTNAFAMTENSEEATNLASGQKVELTSHVATYGYDGLNAYETAVVYGITTALSEKEYVQIRASHVDTNQIASGAITTPKIADDAVTTEKIAASNVTTTKIADSNVTTAKIADSNVTTAKIADSNVTTGKIADGNVTTSKIADSNVTTVKIADGAVTTDKIADSNITTDKVADNAVVTAKIADGNVTTSKIADSNIVTDKIADDAVTTSKIADSNITEDKIADDAVTTSKIKNGNVTTDKILDDNITTDKLATGAVTTAKILDSNVTTGKLADGAVTGNKIADSNVTTTKIADGAVSEGKLASGAVVGAKIADGAVTNGKIADGTIENGKLKDLTIENGKIKDNTIENGKLKDLTIEGGKLKDGTLENGKFKDGSIEGVKIADGAVGGTKIASGSITGGNIAANAVTNDKIGSGEVKSGNIAQGAVTNDKLAQGAITDDKIADGALSTFETEQSARLTDLALEVDDFEDEMIGGESIWGTSSDIVCRMATSVYISMNGYTSRLIAVDGSKVIVVKGNSNGSSIAVVKSFSASPDSWVSFDFATSESECHDVPANNSTTFTTPEDTNYIIVKKIQDNVDYTPTELSIGGKDVFLESNGRVGKLEDKVFGEIIEWTSNSNVNGLIEELYIPDAVTDMGNGCYINIVGVSDNGFSIVINASNDAQIVRCSKDFCDPQNSSADGSRDYYFGINGNSAITTLYKITGGLRKRIGYAILKNKTEVYSGNYPINLDKVTDISNSPRIQAMVEDNRQIVLCGDSHFGAFTSNNILQDLIQGILGVKVFNLGFSGCRMAWRTNDGSNAVDAYTLPCIVDAIVSQDYTLQRNSTQVSEDYLEPEANLEALDFSMPIQMIVEYGLNDHTGNTIIGDAYEDDGNFDPADAAKLNAKLASFDRTTYLGALNYGLLKMYANKPKYMECQVIGGGRIIDDADSAGRRMWYNKQNSNGKTLKDYRDALQLNCNNTGIRFVDYLNNGLYNVFAMRLTDAGSGITCGGSIHNNASGFSLMANVISYIAKWYYSPKSVRWL